MSRRAPRVVLWTLVFVLISSFALSVYLEQRALPWLQDHPIMVNLLSGVVGFSAAFLVVALVFNWFAERESVDQAVKARMLKIDFAVIKVWAMLAQGASVYKRSRRGKAPRGAGQEDKTMLERWREVAEACPDAVVGIRKFIKEHTLFELPSCTKLIVAFEQAVADAVGTDDEGSTFPSAFQAYAKLIARLEADARDKERFVRGMKSFMIDSPEE